jgi:hypothetical protein
MAIVEQFECRLIAGTCTTEDPNLLFVGYTSTSHEWTSKKHVGAIGEECKDFVEQRFSPVS